MLRRMNNPRFDSAAAACPRRGPAGAFTLVELLVVIAIVGILVALGVPAFNTIQRQSQLARTQQLLSGLTQRASLLALADRTPTAVRLCPAPWEQLDDSVPADEPQSPASWRQVATLYQYRFSSLDPDPTGNDWSQRVEFEERFERVPDAPSVVLPNNLWAAPAESLLSWSSDRFEGDGILDGKLDTFEVDAAGGATTTSGGNEELLDADDFLIVFSPETGLAASRWPQGSDSNRRLRRTAWKLLGLKYDADDPSASFETAYDAASASAAPRSNGQYPFRRYNFSGLILYDREGFRALDQSAGGQASVADRREYLAENGRLLWVRRNGGALYAPGDK